MISYTAAVFVSLLLAVSTYGILDEGRKPGEEEDELSQTDEAILEVHKDTPWIIIPLTGNNGRRMVSFRPRLGREEETILAESSRSPPFAPRLGRMMYSPRLGRLA